MQSSQSPSEPEAAAGSFHYSRTMEDSQDSLIFVEEREIEKLSGPELCAAETSTEAKVLILDESDSLIYVEPEIEVVNSPEQNKDSFRLCETAILQNVIEKDESVIYVEQLGTDKDCEHSHANKTSGNFDELIDDSLFTLDFRANNSDINVNNLIPRFHSTPTATPLVASNTTSLLHHIGTQESGPCDSTLQSSQDSLIILEDATNPVSTKKRRLDAETDIPCHDQCCSQNCMSNFTESEMEDSWHFFQSKTVSDQNQFLMSSFQLMSGDSSIQHIVSGKVVCRKAYMQIFKISDKRYKQNFKIFQQNPTVKVTRKSVSRKDSMKVSEAKAWMTRYFNRIGDSMPHMDQIHLPHGLTKRDVYYMMKGQLLEQGLETVMSLSHFYSIWETSFNKVLIPEVCSYV